MILWIIQQILLSIIFITVVHYIYIYFKDNLTVPKTKDLVKKPIEQYKEIYSTMVENKNNVKMKSELKNYIKNLHQKKNSQPQSEDNKNETSKNTNNNSLEINNVDNIHGQISNFTDSTHGYSNF